MKLYSISDKCISFMRVKFPRIYSNKEEEIIYIRKNENKIKKNAKVLYSKKKAGDTTNKVIANCLDYLSAEKECARWIELNKVKD